MLSSPHRTRPREGVKGRGKRGEAVMRQQVERVMAWKDDVRITWIGENINSHFTSEMICVFERFIE